MLLKEDWPQELLESEEGREIRDENGNVIYRGLRLRMGIHWGSPVCEPDPITGRMDYFGPMVNRASRIESAAQGGQIFVSKDVVTELNEAMAALDRQPAEGGALNRPGLALRRMGFGIKEMGLRRLKGLETPELLYSVYTSSIAGRLAYVNQDAAATTAPPRVFAPTAQLLDAQQIRRLALVCVRLEALSTGQAVTGIAKAMSGEERMAQTERLVTAQSALLGNGVTLGGVGGTASEDAPDAELIAVLGQLTRRLANAASKLSLDTLLLPCGLDSLEVPFDELRALIEAMAGTNKGV